MKILIAIPTMDGIKPEVFKAIYGLDRNGQELVFDYVKGYDTATARNHIGKQAISEKADYVLMVDSDTVIPGDTLVNFMEDMKDICLGYYPQKITRFDPIEDANKSCLCKLGEFNYTSQITMEDFKTMRENGVHKIQIHGGGFGCAMIKTELFEKMDFPWFDWVNYEDGQLLSEDLYFCEKCKEYDIPIYADTRIQCGHIFDFVHGF